MIMRIFKCVTESSIAYTQEQHIKGKKNRCMQRRGSEKQSNLNENLQAGVICVIRFCNRNLQAYVKNFINHIRRTRMKIKHWNSKTRQRGRRYSTIEKRLV